jgi:hypothetical protein
MTPWSKVVTIAASHFDVNVAYAAVDRHRLEDNEPYIYRTRDGGKTWQKITNGLTPGVYMQNVTEDRVRKGLLFAGTELSIFVSFNDGDTWQPLQLNLPHVSVRDIAIKDNDLVIATFGRGFWVLDNINPLRQVTDAVAPADAFLFDLADAYRLPPPDDNGTPLPKDEPLAQNAPYGAIIDYYLGKRAGNISLEILNPAGEAIKRFSSNDKPEPVDPDKLDIPVSWVKPTPVLSAARGMHRWLWDLRPEPPPPTAPGGRRPTPATVLPGTYTVKLTVDDRSYSKPIVVRMDPRARF